MEDYSAFPDEGVIEGRVLRRAAARKKNAGDALSQTVQPGNFLPMAYDRLVKSQNASAELENESDDMSGMQDYARSQGESGGAAMLNALAAQFAGESFQPIQAQFLKRAAAAAEPMKVSGGILTPDGQFIKDPAIARESRRKALEGEQAKLMTLIQRAEQAQSEAEARKAQNDVMNQIRLMQAQTAQDSAASRAMMAGLAFNQQQQNAVEKRTRQQETDAQTLSKRLDEVVPLYTKVGQLNETLNKYVPDGKDIPGFGRGSNVRVGGIDASGLFMNAEDKAVRAQLLGVFNALLQAQSGQAVTMPEEQRKRLELMVSSGLNGYTAQDTLNAYNEIVLPAINATVANTGGGFTPEVKSIYNRQGGKVNFEKPYAPLKRRDDNELAPGTIVDGYRYKGGNKADKNNWEKVQ